MATHHLASWAESLQYSDLPPTAIQAAIRSFYNWTGCAIGGSHHRTTTTALKALQPFFGPPTSRILGRSAGPDTEEEAEAVETNEPGNTTRDEADDADFHKPTGNDIPERLPHETPHLPLPVPLPSRTDASHAALLNGIASHVHDYDDTHLETIIHPTGPVASALLAQVDALARPVSGQEFILALAVGIEAECKIGLAVWPDHYDVGWHITSTTGSIGAAAALSKLLHLTALQTAHAIGIASTQVTGLREMFGSDTKSLHVGRAAQNGLLATTLAAQGYTSSLCALEAPRGWANVVGNNTQAQTHTLDHNHNHNHNHAETQTQNQNQKLDHQLYNLGREWEILKNSFKPFPCGIVIHPVIDACVQLYDQFNVREHPLEQPQGQEQEHQPNPRINVVTDIKSVKCTVHPLVLELTGKKRPQDGLQAKFSVFHAGAVGLVLGQAGPAEFEDRVVTDEEIVSVRDRIEAVADARIRPDEAVVEVELGDGRRFKKHVANAIGSLEMPMSDEQLEKKFVDQVAAVVGLERAQRASQTCWGLEHTGDVRRMLDF